MANTGNRYTDEVKNFARSIYKQSPETNTYEKVGIAVSEKFDYPKPLGKSTIGDWIKNGAYAEKAYERTKKYRDTIEGMINKRLLDALSKETKKKSDIVEMSPNRHETVYQLIRERLKSIKGRNGMKATTYIKYWEEHKELEKVSDTEWRLPCGICGEKVIIGLTSQLKEGMQIDHIMPHSRGGTGEPSNLLPIHKKCNQSKSDMTLEEYAKHTSIVSKYLEEQCQK